jgi:selenocysteine lyase/cysteine desulfurase
MEAYFKKFRAGIIGIDCQIPCSDGGTKQVVYADWTASGRNYQPIEDRIQKEIMPLVANTHTETSATGMAMTHAYHEAREVIKRHVNANSEDILITAGSGMTRLVNKFQRILGLRFLDESSHLPPPEKCPVVFITHMEHHSNQTSWLESIATVEIIRATPAGLVDLEHLEELLEIYADRPMKIASVTGL